MATCSNLGCLLLLLSLTSLGCGSEGGVKNAKTKANNHLSNTNNLETETNNSSSHTNNTATSNNPTTNTTNAMVWEPPYPCTGEVWEGDVLEGDGEFASPRDFEKLQGVGAIQGTVVVHSQAAIDAMGCLERIEGHLALAKFDEDRRPQSPQSWDDASLRMYLLGATVNQAALELVPLARLEEIGERLVITYQQQITSLRGLRSLRTVTALELSGNRRLASLLGLEALTEVDTLWLLNNEALASLAALERLVRIHDALKVTGNTNLAPCEIDGLLDQPQLALAPQDITRSGNDGACAR